MLRLPAQTVPLLLATPAILLSQALPDRPYASVEEALAAIDKPLYSNCDPVSVLVNVNRVGSDRDMDKALEITLRDRAETALRTGGIWTDERRPGPMLAIVVNRGGSSESPLDAIFLSVRFNKPAVDDYGTRFVATAWVGFEAAIPGEFRLMLDVLWQRIDEFVIKYLKANSAACSHAE